MVAYDPRKPDLLKGGRGITIGGIPIDHASEPSDYYFQRGVLMVPNEAVDELLEALRRIGLDGEKCRRDQIEGTDISQIRLRTRRRIDELVEKLGGTVPVEPSYVVFPQLHVRGFSAMRPVPAPPSTIPDGPLSGLGRNVNIGVVDFGFFNPRLAGHPDWAIDGVELDEEMALPDPNEVQHSFVGHGNAVVGILKQLAPEATVYTSTLESSRGDAPGGTTDRRLAEAIERLLGRHRIHILVIPFGGSTRHGLMPVTESVLQPHFGSTLMVSSAGNDGLDPTLYPAVDVDVVGAGAWSHDAGRLGWLGEACRAVTPPLSVLVQLDLAKWSNSGLAVQLGAPGLHVPAPFLTGTYTIEPGAEDKPQPVKKDFKGWALFSGTSFSAAVVAGCVAGEVGGDSPPSPQSLGKAVAK